MTKNLVYHQKAVPQYVGQPDIPLMRSNFSLYDYVYQRISLPNSAFHVEPHTVDRGNKICNCSKLLWITLASVLKMFLHSETDSG